ncbi:MAG: hypothetical protein ABIP89_24935 [Polyangiaceae bacterium]
MLAGVGAAVGIAAFAACGGDDSTDATADGGPDSGLVDTRLPGDAETLDASVDGGSDGSAITDAAPEASCADGSFCFAGHLYVANFSNGSGGFLGIYDNPIGPDAGAAFSLGADAGLIAPQDIAYEPTSNTLAVTDFAGKVQLFTAPVGPASLPTTTLTVAFTPVAAAFDASGNLYVTQFAGRLTMYPPPYSDGNAANVTIVVPSFDNLFGASIDPTGSRLAIAGVATGGGTAGVAIFNTPLTAASLPVASFGNAAVGYYGGVAVQAGSGKVYASHTQTGPVEIYVPPFTDGGAAATTINPAGATGVWHLRFTPAGDLLAPNSNNGLFVVDPANPSVARVKITSGIDDVRGAAIAP